ncbi:amino acid ABC transporter permease [Enterovirga sp. DB1703]|uniref:Amino acid ABC transporter permease n=2 Tax=Enterovirga aerilata TaxID=2730920 RepID=A0A849IFN6_9HYPH|nr:amino acid ABC transporter permease [Enterovirga sp. DB1703]
MAASNAIENLRAAKIASGFGFLNSTSGFDVSQTLIPYSATSTYGAAFIVGLLNTLLVAAIGVVLATFLGFLIGIARLSSNWIVARVATAYVELIRNLPLLLQLLFWYIAVLRSLPEPRNSLGVGTSVFLNNRGLYIPRPVFAPDAWIVLAAFALGVVAAIGYAVRAHRRQAATGQQSPVISASIGFVVGLPLLAWAVLALVAANPISFDLPIKGTFNLRGGLQVFPELVALTLGLVIYTAAFIAEIVRAGILAVSKGQTEAAHALGIKPGHTLRLVVIPQAMRVIIPPLTSQYLNLTKNSSLAVVIGYPDLVQVFMGTVLNQTGQAIECVAMTMAVYLTISIATASFMNWYNARKALVER